MSKILPNNFDKLVASAIKKFWSSRTSLASNSQEGNRGSVIGGKNLDGFSEIIKAITLHCGYEEECVVISGKKKLTIPGYFRPTKMWDSLVIYKGHLIAAFELKSQVGSFGNNFNNRTEESIGSAKDFWIAHRDQAFEISNSMNPDSINSNFNKPPFLGYLMLLEDCTESTSPVKVEEDNYKVFPEFKNSSYAQRYQILCEKLIFEGLYSSASLILSHRVKGKSKGIYTSPTPSLEPKSLFADFAGRLLAAKEVLS